MSLNGSLKAVVNFTHTKDNVDLSTPSEVVNQTGSKTVRSGSIYHDTISLTADTASVLTLSGGGLTDVFGQSFDISALSGVYVKAGTGNAGDVYLSGGSDMIFNPLPALGAGEAFMFEGDIAISTSNDELTLWPDSTSGTVDVILIGS